MKLIICSNHFAPSIGGSETVVSKIAERLSVKNEVYISTRRMPGRARTSKLLEYEPKDIGRFLLQIRRINPDQLFVYSDYFDFFRQIVSDKYKTHIAFCGANNTLSHPDLPGLLLSNNDKIKSFICHSGEGT